jgi:hypothetical protein
MTSDPDSSAPDTNLDQLPVLRYYEERRRYPRIEMRSTVILTTEDHQVLKVRMRNLSAEGLQIRCDRTTASKLHPRGKQIVPGTGPRVMLRFDLPIKGTSYPFAGTARLCYVAARSIEEIAFGLQFTRLSLPAKKLLASYMVESMRP